MDFFVGYFSKKMCIRDSNRGMCVELSDFGALVLSVYVLDRHGRNRDVVLGYDNLRCV